MNPDEALIGTLPLSKIEVWAFNGKVLLVQNDGDLIVAPTGTGIRVHEDEITKLFMLTSQARHWIEKRKIHNAEPQELPLKDTRRHSDWQTVPNKRGRRK